MPGIASTGPILAHETSNRYIGLSGLRKALNRRFGELGSWRKVAGEFPGANHSTLKMIAEGKYIPKTRKLKQALGLIRPPSPDQVKQNQVVAMYRRMGRYAAKYGEGFIG